VIPDTGGVARLFQICGHGVASDLVLTGRPMDAAEAYAHGIVSRLVPGEKLDVTVREMAEKIAAAPYVTVRMARRVIRHLGEPQVRASMAEELITQTFVNGSHDYAEFRAARAREPGPLLHRKLGPEHPDQDILVRDVRTHSEGIRIIEQLFNAPAPVCRMTKRRSLAP
jgi:Enoyl-CoA hydratase/isomerase